MKKFRHCTYCNGLIYNPIGVNQKIHRLCAKKEFFKEKERTYYRVYRLKSLKITCKEIARAENIRKKKELLRKYHQKLQLDRLAAKRESHLKMMREANHYYYWKKKFLRNVRS